MAQCFKEFYFSFYFISFQFANYQPTVFTPTLKSKFNSPFLTSLKSFVRRKPILVFDPRPLYCSSLTTAVGGTTDTNFVDSAHPTVARINNPDRDRATDLRSSISISAPPNVDAPLDIKRSRSALTKCSPTTTSNGSRHGITRRLEQFWLHLTSANFFKVRRTL